MKGDRFVRASELPVCDNDGILQRNYRKMTLKWSFPVKSFVKLFLYNKILSLHSPSRTEKKLRTSKGDYWIKHWFTSIVSLFKMGTSLKGKNLLPEGANSFYKSSSLKSSSLWYGKSRLLHKVTSLECYYFYYTRA